MWELRRRGRRYGWVLPLAAVVLAAAPLGVAPALGEPSVDPIVPTHDLTVTTTGPGTVAGSGIDCGATCSATLDEATEVTLTATPDAHSTFTGWDGACTGSSTDTCIVTMDEAKTVGATFAKIQHDLTVTPTGPGSVTGGGIDCGATCSATLDEATEVTLTATPDAHSTFTGWGGACSGADTSCVVTMSEAKSVTATFAKIQHALTVTPAGTGSGTVASDFAGISCGATCSSLYDEADVVTLTPTPASGSKFSGWSGDDCTGTGTCVVTMSEAKSVTATFDDDTAPTISIVTPVDQAHYPLGATVKAGYACADEAGGSGLLSCLGTVKKNDQVDTATPGVKSFTVTATDNAGHVAKTTVTYTVDQAPPPLDTVAPSLDIHSPVYGGHYLRGARRMARFSCSDNTGGSGLAVCAGTGASGTPIDTRTVGQKYFKLLARDRAGNEVGFAIPYTVDPSCAVPALGGSSLAHARRLLKGAGCALGRVLVPARRPGHSRGRLVVASQSPHADGAIRRAGARVDVRLRRAS